MHEQSDCSFLVSAGRNNMSNKIRVNIPDMEKDMEEINTLAKDVSNDVERLADAMQQLGRCWEGAAWISFQSQVADDIEYMREVFDFIQSLQEGLEKSAKTYFNSEKENYESFKRMWI